MKFKMKSSDVMKTLTGKEPQHRVSIGQKVNTNTVSAQKYEKLNATPSHSMGR